MSYLPSREAVLHAIDRAIAGESSCLDNLAQAKYELNRLQNQGYVESEWYITSHRRYVGKAIIFVKRFLRKMLHGYIPRLVLDFNERHASQQRVMLMMLECIEKLEEENQELRSKIQSVNESVQSIDEKATEMDERFCSMQENIRSVEQKMIKSAETQANEIDARFHSTQESIRSVEQKMIKFAETQANEIDARFHSTQESIRSVEQKMIKSAETQATEIDNRFRSTRENIQSVIQKTDELDKRFTTAEWNGTFSPNRQLWEIFNYTEFEDKYRGEFSLILEWQTAYVDYFKNCKSVLDLGCGRGEFLHLMKLNNIPAKGIDISDSSIQRCIDMGFDVEKADIFEYLSAAGDGTIGGIFCAQVVEHFTAQQLLRFVVLLSQKLSKGAPVVIETINPSNVQSVCNWFHMDLSHQRPVHPLTLEFLLEKNGFENSSILSMHPNDQQKVPALPMQDAEEFNFKMNYVNNALFGAQDYALVAYKK